MFKIGTKLKRILALIVAVLFVILLFSTLILNITSADQKTDLQNKQQNLSDDKQNIKSEINELEAEKETVLAEKEKLDVEVTAIEQDIDDVNVKIEGYEQSISEVEAELEKAEEKLDAQYETYKKRIRVMYENGSTGYLDVLLSSDSIGDFFEKIEVVSQIAEYDSNLMNKLKEEKQKIQDKKDELETLKGRLVDSKNVLQDKKDNLDSKMRERDAMIQQIEGSQEALEKQLKEIEAQEAEVRRQIAALSGGGSSNEQYVGGSMLWPTPSCRIITSPYGWRLHPVLKYEKLHTGIDIGAGYGAKIIAVQSGKVIKATYNGAYGNYVVVDHGGGVCTLYAHQSSMAVSVGQKVSAGDTIGYVGSTGYSTGPHLHFEVIINGSTVDPMGYIG